MRSFALQIGILGSVLANGQVDLTSPAILTGPGDQRNIIGLAPPVSDSAAITVGVVASGLVHWATAIIDVDTIVLHLDPAVTGYRSGLLLRFLPPTENRGDTWLRIDGLQAYQMLRSDGIQLPYASLRAGSVAEVLCSGSSWVLLNASTATCPPGSLLVTSRLCIDVDNTPGLLFYPAIDHCAKRGGKLCTWDEYAVGCALLQGQLSDLFNEWEWIDDTANHTHTANQAGRYTCESERSANVITLMTGDTRCCYHPR